MPDLLINDLALLCNFLSNSAGLTSFLLNVSPDAKVKAIPLKEWHTAQQDGGKVRMLKFICRFCSTNIACKHIGTLPIVYYFIVAVQHSILVCIWRLFEFIVI